MKLSDAHSLYQQNSMAVESPVKLVEMLYEGILRFCGQAARAIQTDHIEKKVYYINRVVNIFTELLSTLDHDRGGEVAAYLAGLYTHQIKLLFQANAENDVQKIHVVVNVVRGLLDAWREIHGKELA